MRLATLRRPDGSTVAARVEGDEVEELGAPDVRSLLLAGGAAAAGRGPRHRLDEVDLAPVVRGGKVICLGLNYRSHIEETARELPRYPTLFAKFTEAIIGPRDPIVLPSASDQVDWEVELGVVIGRPLRHADRNEASAAIAGYTVVNDISVRDWQNRTLQWLQGKTFESTTPVGPVLVSPDEIDHAGALAVRCLVDDQVMQEANTADLLFKPAEVVAYISTILTLQPGDLISTGTPAGVGASRTPPLFLRPGQVVTTAIDGIGELVNRCVAEQR
ncbi:MAG TPA: fumarylacetoacetate hydrolase family protein [Acidimicrobiales bacterium]|nr:fumarylacetoacetate hydrolase family protein [Acidimicrobiales bacterium]